MTICTAALCTDGDSKTPNAVVLASDRMVTMGKMTEFEHEIPKIARIRNLTVALIAGDALRGSHVVSETARMAPAAPTVRNIAEAAANQYIQLRAQQIEVEFFQSRGFTRADFYANKVPGVPQNIAFQVDQQVVSFNFGVDLLVAGVDDSGAHVFYVGNPGGSATDFAQVGFCAIGSGMIHATQSLIGFGQNPNRSVAETLFAMYVAKRRAEAAPGVGLDTDIQVIRKAGISEITKGGLTELDGCFKEIQRPTSKEIIDKVSKLL